MKNNGSFDAVVVGARCAGSPVAIRLAQGGWKVLLVDPRPPPHDTTSTHFVFPNVLARLDELQVLDRILDRHKLNMLKFRVRILGHETAGAFTPVNGFDRGVGPRRTVLDRALLDVALRSGAQCRWGESVIDVLGSGTPEDPVTGVVLDSGSRINARWVVGADGRNSTIASRLRLRKERCLNQTCCLPE